MEYPVVGLAQVEGGAVENGAAVAAGRIVEESGIADHILRSGIGANEHPDGAASAEIS